MKKIVLILTILISVQTIYAQEYQLKGRIVSPGSVPVEYANVILRDNDSVFISGGITDQRGRFQMDNIRNGNYNLQISSIGFETRSMNLADFNKNTDLGNVIIDSASIALDEVTITASHIINQPDKKIVLPTSAQIKASHNGLSLLQQLQLSRIYVDQMQRKISVSGGETVQLRINGVEVSVDEVNALRPEEILRIEHHDDPGLRYNGADAVIDFITRRKESGGHITVDTQNSPHVWFGNNFLNAKVNYKKSEFAALYSGGYRSMSTMWRENSETFNFADGSSLTRVEDGTPDKWANNWNYMHLNYNYQEPEKYFFNATLRANVNGMPRMNYKSNLYPVGHPENGVQMTDRSRTRDIIPSLDLYYQRTLKNNQTVILNLVGTYISSENDRAYMEKKENEILTDIITNVEGDKYSVIAEGIYEKGFKNSKLSAGLKHTQSISDNEYTGNTIAHTKMKQSDTYAYAEFQQKINKFNYAVGMGVSRAWFKQSGEGYTNYNLRPTVRLTYNITDNMFLRYRGVVYSNSPSLSDLSETQQLIDTLQIRRGNPNLKPVRSIDNHLTYNMRHGILSTNLQVMHSYQHKPIMEEVLRENNKFVRMVDNQKSWQRMATELEIKVGPIKDILTISFTNGLRYFDSKGNNYHHTHTNWYYRIDVMANYKNFSANFQMQNHMNNLYGETLFHNENFHILGINYRHKNLTVGVMTLNPFVDNWKSGWENVGAYTPSKNWHYMKESSRLFAVKVAYNFSFGRKYQSASKRLNNEDTQSGVMSGGK